MIVVKFAEELRKEVRVRMNELTDAVATGRAESFDQYQAMCGEIRGLAIAESMLLAAAERMEKLDV